MFRRLLLVLSCVALCALALAGCSVDARDDLVPTETRVRVSGSGTGLPLFKLLADRYGSDSVEFVYLPGLHSGSGIEGVVDGELELGVVSRRLTAQEESLGLEYVQLSDDGVVMAVHPSVTLRGLTAQQVRDIYAGRYSNWSELGGPALGIVVLDRSEDDGVVPSVTSIGSGAYDMTRPRGVVVASPVSPEIADFLTWVRSSDVETYVSGKGFAPPSES